MVARRLAGYAVAMEMARRPEGPEVNGDVEKTVSRRSLVPSRERKRKGCAYAPRRNDYVCHAARRRRTAPILNFCRQCCLDLCIRYHKLDITGTASVIKEILAAVAYNFCQH